MTTWPPSCCPARRTARRWPAPKVWGGKRERLACSPPAFVTAAAELGAKHVGMWRAGGARVSAVCGPCSARESAPLARRSGREKSGYRLSLGPPRPCSASRPPTAATHARACATRLGGGQRVCHAHESATKRERKGHTPERKADDAPRSVRVHVHKTLSFLPTVIATLGPACRDVDVLKAMLQAGMSCARVDLTVRVCV